MGWNSKSNCSLLGLTVLLALTSIGCATSGSGKPASHIRNAKREYAKGNMHATLVSFERAVAISPAALEKKRFADELTMYQDAQIKYGTEMAAQAESEGRLLHAWVWNVQLSIVDPNRDECRNARDAAVRLKAAIGKDYLRQARQFLETQDTHAALLFASRSLWFGEEQAEGVMDQIAARLNPSLDSWQFDPIREEDVRDLVRTDSIERLTPKQEFAPYGIPIYFGDIPRYYVSLGTITVKGYPIPQDVPPEFTKLDALSKLSEKAGAKFNPDALINVHFWTKSKKAFTVGEAVRFVQFPDSGDTGLALVSIAGSAPDLPLPRTATTIAAAEMKKSKPRTNKPRK